MTTLKQHLAKIKKVLNGHNIVSHIEFDEINIHIIKDDIFEILKKLKNDYEFEQLVDLTAIDYSTYGDVDWETDNKLSTQGFSRGRELIKNSSNDLDGFRYAIVYHLLNFSKNLRIRLKAFLPDESFIALDSVCGIYSSANWYEREVYDMFGIYFNNHPDLRRILTDYGFVGHPLRKDFPMVGHVEMRYDEKLEKVIYEPVEIENRVNNPRVIRK